MIILQDKGHIYDFGAAISPYLNNTEIHSAQWYGYYKSEHNLGMCGNLSSQSVSNRTGQGWLLYMSKSPKTSLIVHSLLVRERLFTSPLKPSYCYQFNMSRWVINIIEQNLHHNYEIDWCQYLGLSYHEHGHMVCGVDSWLS